MNNTVFVTALYHYTPLTRIGGRGWNLSHWKAPFKNLLALNIPLVIYTQDTEAKSLEEFLDSQNFDQYEIIIQDLNTYRLSDKIYQLKEQQGIINENGLAEGNSVEVNQRNYHLCLQKINWLNTHANNNTFNGEKYLWIDLGLFHHGLFPDSLGGQEKLIPIREETFWPLNQLSMFTPALGEGIYNICDDRFLCIQNETYPTSEVIARLAGIEHNLGYIIGGMFGGNREVINLVHDEFNQIIDSVYANDILSLEELILSAIYSKYPDRCNVLKFNNWYHDCPGGKEVDRCCYGIGENDKSFYRIFYNDILKNEK